MHVDNFRFLRVIGLSNKFFWKRKSRGIQIEEDLNLTFHFKRTSRKIFFDYAIRHCQADNAIQSWSCNNLFYMTTSSMPSKYPLYIFSPRWKYTFEDRLTRPNPSSITLNPLNSHQIFVGVLRAYDKRLKANCVAHRFVVTPICLIYTSLVTSFFKKLSLACHLKIFSQFFI